MSRDEQPRLLLALTPLAERSVEELLFGSERPVAVVGSATDAGELLALTDRNDADAVLLSAELAGLGEQHCARLRAHGLRLLGLALDEHNTDTLTALGIDVILRTPLTADELAAACTSAPTSSTRRQRLHEADAAPRDRAADAGSIVAVIGSPGAGASECAASLAALANQHWSALLVELDLLTGSLDLRLGCDPHRGSLLGLVRAAGEDGALGELVERWTCGGERGWPSVLLAPPDLDSSIDELDRPGAIRASLDALTALYPLVVCNVGALLTAPGQLPRIARCHREALLAADAVLLVLGAREAQLRAGRAQLALLLDALAIKRERLRLCVNGAGAPGASKRAELEQALAAQLAELRLAVDAWLPYDRRALARAQQTGLPFALARPRGPYARALKRLLGELLLPARPVPRERKTRLPIRVPVAHGHADEEVKLPWRS